MSSRRILIVDDDPHMRELLALQLKSWGHEVAAASDGEQAWSILQRETINLIITDWFMPGISGTGLCRRIRGGGFGHYIYLIILTAKSEKHLLAEAMAAGADDYILKANITAELQVRINAGLRVLDFQTKLNEQNQELRHKHEELEKAYSVIREDLKAAAKMQYSLLPRNAVTNGGVQIQSLFMPCELVAGDIFNFFEIDEKHTGFYLLDVAGHGVRAAMLSVTLSKLINPGSFRVARGVRNPEEHTYLNFINPARMAEVLNATFQDTEDGTQYFTMIYGKIDSETRSVVFTQAGHPSPIFHSSTGMPRELGTGGYPIGVFPGVGFENFQFSFERGDRLFIYSDGITECTNREDETFSRSRLMQTIAETRDAPMDQALDILKQRLTGWTKDDAFEDDLSLLAFQF